MSSDWATLPRTLLDFVLERLMLPSDYLAFSIVCRSWHHRARDNKKQLARISGCQRTPPMLLIPTGENGVWRLYKTMNDKVYYVRLKLRNKRFCGSSKGWLIAVEKDFRITLINPFRRIKGRRMMENSTVYLPPITIEGWTVENSTASECEYCVIKATISADPILLPNECTVAVTYLAQLQLAFFRLGKDITWNYIDQRYSLIEDLVFVEDRIYTVDDWRKLLSIDIATPTSSDVKKLTCDMKQLSCRVKQYVAALNEREFFMVRRYVAFDSEYNNRMTKEFEVFKLDFDKGEWIAKNTLGDVALFVGENSSIALSASAFSGCEPDCIYYNHDYECMIDNVGTLGPVDYGVYNVKTRRFSKAYGKLAMSLVKKARQSLIWVSQTINL